MALLAAAVTLSSLVTVTSQATVQVSWSSVVRPLQTTVAFQVSSTRGARSLPGADTTRAGAMTRPPAQTVVNPVTCRESPYHDAVYEKIASLGAPYQRYVPWLPCASSPPGAAVVVSRGGGAPE